MSTAVIDEQILATLIGYYDHGDLLLFKVARELAPLDSDQWSEPLQLRFVKTRGALVELQMRRVQ